LLQTLWSIFILSAFLLIAAAVGDRIVRRLRLLPPDAGDSDRLIFSLALGLGAVALITFGVGMAGALRPAPLFGTLAAIGLICARGAFALVGAAGRLLSRAGRFVVRLVRSIGRRPGWGANLWLLTALVLGGIEAIALFIGALAPPAGADYDALAYHLALPALYLRWGAIRYDPYILHSNFPQVIEMLYLVMLAAGAQAARTVHFVFGLLAACACGSLCRRYGRAAAIIGALVFWMTPVVAWEAGSGYDDLAFALFQTLAFLACVRAFDRRPGERWLVLAGICQGLALGVKYTALAFVPLLLIAGAATVWRQGGPGMGAARSRLRSVLQQTGIAGLAAAIVASPWYARALIWTGNPVFPYYYSLFGGRNWSREAERFYRHLQIGYGAGHALGSGRGPLDFLTAPWHLIAVPQYYYEPGGSAGFGVLRGSIGLAYLLLIGLNFIRGEWKPAAAALALLFGAFFIEWYLLMQQVRYLIPALPLLTPACALALSPLLTSGRASEPGGPDTRPAAWFAMTLAAMIVLTSFGWSVWVSGQLAVWGPGPSAALVDVGAISRDDYLSQRLPDLWLVSEWVNINLPANARVALISEPRSYYIHRDTLWADGYEQEKLRYSKMRTAHELAAALRKAGITDVLIRVGSPYGLVGTYGLPHANPSTADWSSLNYHGPLSHWITLYHNAIDEGLLNPIYPQSGAATDPNGYAVYEVEGAKKDEG